MEELDVPTLPSLRPSMEDYSTFGRALLHHLGHPWRSMEQVEDVPDLQVPHIDDMRKM
jgi:hypothetical protein